MCGLTGFLDPAGTSEQAAYHAIGRMTSAITHRGPDSEGHWAEEGAGLVLGHRRLSILDLSPAGHQPMHSACGRYVIAFNGEIYNHLDVRCEVRGARREEVRWRGHSDTETLLAAFTAWGVEETLKRCVGMFAIALWDRQKRTLTLARDRFGEKPLYYGFAQGLGSAQGHSNEDGSVTGRGPLLFGSELKSLMAHPEWQGTLANEALEDYLRFGCVGGEASIFQGVAKLPPGSLVTITQADVQAGRLPAPVHWWSAEQAAREAMAEQPLDSPQTAITAVEEALGDSVRNRMLADVPLGAFLSGGVDSSLIVALMQSQAERPVRTFSVGFDDARYDESSHAEAVARHLGTEHLTLQATSRMALDLVPSLPDLYDEPFADSSQLPTALVSKLTRKHVTVALSGDAGDELFGGYNRHLWVPRIWHKIRRLPLPARRALAATLKTIPAHRYDTLMRHGGRLLPKRLRMRTFGEKLHKLAAVLESSSERALFAGVASMNREPDTLLAGQGSGKPPEALFPALAKFDSVEWMLLMDTLHYMVDDVLVKVDRASMASSLEVRVPFLDPEVFHAAWRIPSALHLKEGQGKWVLRQLLFRHVPRELIERPKMGFAIPLDAWLRGPLRDWAEELLSTASLAELPMLDAGVVRRLWQAHLKGQGHHAQQLWAVLQLLAWQRRWG
ncbi:asparagine synthase (glutamine-hydrolyzing) [Halomonas icarae]|uniref:asparagine synthase (glutamine-hydrolyzing) n=1 Tax=Halomonas icarae TaxID=2691040 RepID=A0A7X4VX04_9GAMM|nr:asparagine synthase (glutamine-hydrolyzing) [Halomonas icarae]MDR5903029.1 asparagine synthase (glutamine-hydrolyzing) [Halomonas icarae]NAW11585.1 asparagine synthase (glutamine-hydrolyzing) [Halomonas icarae]